MSKGKNIAIGAATGIGLLMLAGTATALGQSISDDAAQSASQDAEFSVSASLPPAPQSARIINRTSTVPAMPASCTDYLNRVDKVIQSVYDYENGIAPADGALSQGLGALVDGDAGALNEARTTLNHVQNNTTGPLQAIVEAHKELVATRAACEKDLGR